MFREKVAFTDLTVRSLKAPESGQLTYWDAKSPLGVRVTDRGHKTYVVLVSSGRRQTIGNCRVVSLCEARTEARRLIAEKTLGIPREAKAIRFETAVGTFLEENYKGKSARTLFEVRRLLTSHFMPAFRARRLAQISDRDIALELKKIADRPSEQLHAFRSLRAFFRWCTRPPRRYIPYSPLEGYAPPSRDRKGTRVLSDNELRRVWLACEGRYGDMVRLLILWGTRNGETARIRPSWARDGVLIIPASATKNKRAHAIPLLPIAAAILKRHSANGTFYFPDPERTGHFKDGSWGKYKKELEKRSGVSGWQLRDLRRTFRSNMARLGVSRDVAEALLNHVTGAGKNGLDEIYNRYDYLDEKRAALSKWEAQLARVLNPAASSEAA